jgi:hypothetical protein
MTTTDDDQRDHERDISTGSPSGRMTSAAFV